MDDVEQAGETILTCHQVSDGKTHSIHWDP